MKKVLLAIVLSVSLSAFSQTKFEKGYYITNTGEKVEGFIKNEDWRSNPTQFEFRASEASKTEQRGIKDVKEFNIIGFSKYVREAVDIDKSSNNLNAMSYDPNPVFSQETIFLKALVEGSTTLYIYEQSDMQYYFYATNTIPLQQLIYKQYYIERNGSEYLAENKKYLQQLAVNVNCEGAKTTSFENIRYKKNDLVKYFDAVNTCKGDVKKEVLYSDEKRKGDFNISASVILNRPSFEYNGNKFDTQSKIGFGVEAEYVFPFNNNKWSVIIEPNYYSSSNDMVIYNDKVTGIREMNFTSKMNVLNVPVGVRYYFYLSKESKIFVNLLVNQTFYLGDSGTKAVRASNGQEVRNDKFESGTGLGYGIGYAYRAFSVEVRGFSELDLTPKVLDGSNEQLLNNYSFTLRYKLF